MSYRKETFLIYEKTNLSLNRNLFDSKSEEETRALFLEVLQGAMHGLCFSAYDIGQQPGDKLSEEQVMRRMKILKPYVSWIRSFSCIEGNELIPIVAHKLGIKTLVGAWLGNDKEKNEEEISNLIKLAQDGYVDIAAVGNEVLYRGDLTEDELLEYIHRVKAAIPAIPVGYVDAYYEFSHRPALAEVSDVILCNCYPFWEGTDFENSLGHMQYMVQTAAQAGKGKKVIITETGWPTKGKSLGNAHPSHMNAMKYFINTHLWASDENIDVFYFSSFDEDWKTASEGDVGAYWGIWDKYEKLKF